MSALREAANSTPSVWGLLGPPDFLKNLHGRQLRCDCTWTHNGARCGKGDGSTCWLECCSDGTTPVEEMSTAPGDIFCVDGRQIPQVHLIGRKRMNSRTHRRGADAAHRRVAVVPSWRAEVLDNESRTAAA